MFFLNYRQSFRTDRFGKQKNIPMVKNMKRQLISFVLMMLNLLPMLAYDRYGRDYSVRDGGGSSGFLMIIILVAFFLYCFFNAGNKDK